MQCCDIAQSGTRHGRAGALTLELAVASSQGQVSSSTQALMRQGKGEGTRTGTSLFFWSYSEGNGPQGRRARCRHLGKVPLETLEWDCSPTAVMQAAASLLSNTEKQHKPSQEQEKLPMAAQSRGAGHADRTAGLGTGVQQSVGT